MRYVSVILSTEDNIIRSSVEFIKELFNYDMYKVYKESVLFKRKELPDYIWINKNESKIELFQIDEKQQTTITNIKFKKIIIPDLVFKEITKNYKLIDKNKAITLITGYLFQCDNKKYEDLLYSIRSKIPNKLKQCNHKYLYRGIKLSDEDIKTLDTSGSYSLKKKKLTSWTFTESNAWDFGIFDNYVSNKYKHGCVIKIPTPQDRVILNMKFIDFNPLLSTEDEIILEENGVDTINNDNIVVASWREKEEDLNEKYEDLDMLEEKLKKKKKI